jgi:hypothetical protein
MAIFTALLSNRNRQKGQSFQAENLPAGKSSAHVLKMHPMSFSLLKSVSPSQPALSKYPLNDE